MDPSNPPSHASSCETSTSAVPSPRSRAPSPPARPAKTKGSSPGLLEKRVSPAVRSGVIRTRL